MADINYLDLIKQTITKARSARDKKDSMTAAKYYAQAADFMMSYAAQANDRESENFRKARSLEYREIAKRLKAGEDLDPPPTPKPTKLEGPSQADKDESELRQAVSALIYRSPTTWDDIGGLDETKREIKLTLGMSMAQPPENVKISPWTKILLYGPPGTGKTLLAAATSNAIKTNDGRSCVFFNVKVSNVLSKYFGESSKIVSELYGMARDTSPSVVFLDEFESIAKKRGGDEMGAERRLLSSLLSELDGLDAKGKESFVLTVAATNRPWDLDDAVLSRFEKMILVPLPDQPAREAILNIHLVKRGYRALVPVPKLAEMSDGYSGREIERFCKGAIKGMINEMNQELPSIVERGVDAVRDYRIRVRDLTMEDFDGARKFITPITNPEEMKTYVKWAESLEV